MKKFARILLPVLCFLCVVEAKAQNIDLYSIKLKSGLTIKCEIVQIIPDSNVTIKQYGTVSVIHCSEIISITHSGYKMTDSAIAIVLAGKTKKKVVLKPLPETEWTFGLQLNPSLMYMQDYDFFTGIGNQVSFVAMKGLNKRVETGLAIGLNALLDNEEAIFGIVSGNMRYLLMKDKPKAPILYAHLGYGTNLTAVNIGRSGGVNYGVGMGFTSRTRRQDIFTLMLGFKVQNRLMLVRDNQFWWDNQPEYKYVSVSALEIRLEWRF